ncbi:anti-sigma factor [Caballeronia sp. J97]|uniref:anti-sigma factor n=1 Tax=Caballeronia sp. J97 TaxID=2805429 RepID=UPI002AB11E14|nr:anti-sigma factor [Caballeronia sp. J97]
MDEPLTERDMHAFRRAFAPVAPRELKSALRHAFVGVCVAVAAAGWCLTTQVSPDMLDAVAVMALMETSGQRGTNVRALVSHDPHFAELAPVGLELIESKTRRVGTLAHIDEFDYRNANGDAVVLLIASSPFAREAPHWSAQRAGNIRLLTWTSGGKRCVLAGRADTRVLMCAADALTLTARQAHDG